MAGLVGVKAYGAFSLSGGEGKTFKAADCLIIVANRSSGRSFFGYKASNEVITFYETASASGADYGDIEVKHISSDTFSVTNKLGSNVTLRILVISCRLENALVC